MREIITLQLGACGNHIGSAFWNVIAQEHGINNCGRFAGVSWLQSERLNVYFSEGNNNRYYARAICADTDPSGFNSIRNSLSSCLFHPDYMIHGQGGTGNNYAKGYCTEGANILEPILEKIRYEAESADCLQGFNVIHSLGGGTGSGLGSLIFKHLAEEYPNNLVMTFSVFPTPKVADSVVCPYNCLLSFPQLIENTQLTFCVDNEALFDICVGQLNRGKVSMVDLNHIIAHTMSGVTTCFRFPGQLNSGLRKLHVNMVPFPNLHFLVPGFAPLTSVSRVPYQKLGCAELVVQLFNSKNLLAHVDLRAGKTLTIAAIFRGLMSPKMVDNLMRNIKNKNSDFFVDWIPDSITTGICDIPPPGLNMTSTFIGNTNGINNLLVKVSQNFKGMYQRKAYLHWFTSEGLEEADFINAHDSLKSLIGEYKDIGRPTDEEKEPICKHI